MNQRSLHRLAVRAYSELWKAGGKKPSRKRAKKPPRWPRRVLIFDTETTIDPTQALLFGSYMICEWERGRLVIVETGIFFADDLPKSDPKGLDLLTRFAAEAGMPVMSRAVFVEDVLYPMALDARALVVGFNLPFDLSRIAVHFGPAKKRYYGGFSLALTMWTNESGETIPHPYRPAICIRSLNSKQSFIGFAGAKGRKGKRGRFLDLRTLVFSMTGKSHSLDSACRVFGLEIGKTEAQHGSISTDYIRYNLNDLELTRALLEKLREEFDRHPIELTPDKSFSPASVSKSYLREMGIVPFLRKFKSLPRKALGIAMFCYFGGRAEVRIRKVAAPVVYVDFLSMYPTVNCLLGIWDFMIAGDLEWVESTQEVREFLETLTFDALFEPATWPNFCFFAEVLPEEDIFPIRTRYNPNLRSRNIGLNQLCSDHSIWYAGPDLIASWLLTGKIPKIRRAFRLVPIGQQSELQKVKLGGIVEVDPARDDFFRKVIEERKNPSAKLEDFEKTRHRDFLKLLANSGSYGVGAEMISERVPDTRPETMRVQGPGHAFKHETTRPESPGEYCFPPLAAQTTSAARLMLAMLERCVTYLGGTYAFCDTDSLAIVATKDGGLIPCPGGAHRTPDGAEAVLALSWAQVRSIADQFDHLSPYDPMKLRGAPILELEDENFEDDEQRQLYVFAISAKRYAFFVFNAAGNVEIVKHSEHGLGHVLSPVHPDAEDRDWMKEAWQWMIERHLEFETTEPDWLDLPAISRTTMSTPHLSRAFASLNENRPYQDQIKPFGFLLSAHVVPLGHPPGVDATRFHLYAPYDRDPAKWTDLDWFDVHSGERHGVTTRDLDPPDRVRIKTYRDLLMDYEHHPEPKSLGPDGRPCHRRSVGLLGRRPINAAGPPQLIGKEANDLEAVQAGEVHDWDDVLAEYPEPEDGWWVGWVLPRLREIPARDLADAFGVSVSYVKRIRNGNAVPTPRLQREIGDFLLRAS